MTPTSVGPESTEARTATGRCGPPQWLTTSARRRPNRSFSPLPPTVSPTDGKQRVVSERGTTMESCLWDLTSPRLRVWYTLACDVHGGGGSPRELTPPAWLSSVMRVFGACAPRTFFWRRRRGVTGRCGS